MIVNREKLAEIVGKSVETITVWMKAGMPVEEQSKSRKGNKFDTVSCIDWLIKTKGSVSGLNEERTRFTKVQADLKELELEIMNGGLLRAEDVENTWSKACYEIKTKFMSIAPRAATLLQGVETPAESKAIIENLIREVLDDLSK